MKDINYVLKIVRIQIDTVHRYNINLLKINKINLRTNSHIHHLYGLIV